MASASVSGEAFARSLSESGLLSVNEIEGTVGTTATGGLSVVDGGQLAEKLVHEGKLTAYQAKAVLEQRLEDLRIGNYEVLARLGAGAMGTVYKARHRRMKRIVAIKVLSQAMAKPAFINRFQREVETLAQLIHPNIIMAFDADEHAAGPFLVMEFVDGRDLATIVQESGPLSREKALDAITQAARGLEYAHAKNIIHRDIKPANIMWDNSGVIKVADLGLARLVSEHDKPDATAITQAGSIVGTVDFMSPEQAVDSTAIDHRADIYALGCTLYFLLAGKPPFQGSSVMAVLLKHRDAAIPSLREIRPDVPAELDAVLHGMMAKNPAARTLTMTAVIHALEQIKAGLGHTTAPPAAGRTIADLTVILVEPSRVQAGIVRRYFQELGIEQLHIASSGEEAMDLARQHDAQVVVSAMHLADVTGMQLAQMIRADAAHAGLGFVLASSGTEAEDIAALRAMPHTVLMPKPFDAQKLANALAEATGCNIIAKP